MSANLHRLLALVLLGAVGLAGYWLIGQLWLGKYQYYRDNVAQLQDRWQRYTGIVATRPALETGLQQINQDSSVERFYLSQTSSNLAATELQQQVKAIIEGNDGRLASTQVLPDSDEGGFTRVTIRMQILVDDVAALQKILYALESATPLFFMDNIQLRARTVRKRVPVVVSPDPAQRRNRQRQPVEVKTETQLTLQFELAGFMRKGSA